MVHGLCNGMNTNLYKARANQLDIRLHLVRMSLESLLPDWNSPGDEQRCAKLFTDLAEICTVSPGVQNNHYVHSVVHRMFCIDLKF